MKTVIFLILGVACAGSAILMKSIFLGYSAAMFAVATIYSATEKRSG